jgi:hypothetical protein
VRGKSVFMLDQTEPRYFEIIQGGNYFLKTADQFVQLPNGRNKMGFTTYTTEIDGTPRIPPEEGEIIETMMGLMVVTTIPTDPRDNHVWRGVFDGYLL